MKLCSKPSCLIAPAPSAYLPPPDHPAKGSLSLPEVRIAIFYVMLASAWIIGSDALLENMVGRRADTLFFQTFKGLNFVITTGMLLFFVLSRAYGGWRKSEELRLAYARTSGERFRKLSSRIQSLREEERTRISREIHDELGQLLTGTKMQLRIIEDRLADRDDRTLNPLIDALVESALTIDQIIESIHRISAGLRPLALDQLGLATALKDEALQFSRRTDIDVNVDVVEGEDPLPAEIKTTAFRIFQESLTNVARHAEATHVTVECRVDAHMLSLKIRDNGLGIDVSAIGNPQSLGIIGMLERAEEAGGKVEFTAHPGNGTEVALTIPLPGPNDPLTLAP